MVAEVVAALAAGAGAAAFIAFVLLLTGVIKAVLSEAVVALGMVTAALGACSSLAVTASLGDLMSVAIAAIFTSSRIFLSRVTIHLQVFSHNTLPRGPVVHP